MSFYQNLLNEIQKVRGENRDLKEFNKNINVRATEIETELNCYREALEEIQDQSQDRADEAAGIARRALARKNKVHPTNRTLRSSVVAFAHAMEEKLRENDYKGHWEHCTLQYLSMRLTQEREELRKAVERGNPTEVLREAADVANFCMMITEHVQDTASHKQS